MMRWYSNLFLFGPLALANAMVGNNVAINCTFTVPNGQQFDIVAGNSATLGPGFSAELGSAFNVRIEPTVCN